MVTQVTRVGIVEDEALMRGMLEETLSAQESVRVVHAVPGATEARLVFAPGSCDVALLDVNLPDGNGVALGLALQRADPDLAVMLLSSEDVMGLFTTVQDQATRPWSYLSKRSSFARDVLVRAVVAAARGEVVLDPYLVRRSTPRAGSDVAGLTPAQFGVLRLVAEGLSNQAAAERLGINERSVESHLKSIYQRLGIDGAGHNRRVAAVLAFLEQTGRSWRT
ncbi:response regulator transcription factor [Cellulosimicrobium cellulans]|uniref:response regulator transcription factor n=1 Tax=Cellulosimicrobium cellulans TaxID=1710 RepID=UPI003649D0C8